MNIDSEKMICENSVIMSVLPKLFSLTWKPHGKIHTDERY